MEYNYRDFMFKNDLDLHKYIKENYLRISDERIDENHFDIFCSNCNIVRGFQVTHISSYRVASMYGTYQNIYSMPFTIYFRCPVCTNFKLWIVLEIKEKYTDQEGRERSRNVLYKITSLPNEGIENIEELPDKPPALRTAYQQAIRAMDANANLAAAAMFRRAIQVITRDLMGIKPGNLANELEQVIGTTFNGVVRKDNFKNIAYIIKEAGNQGAHPDKDQDLLDFTSQDAIDLRNIFLSLVSEIFIVPAAIEKAKNDFIARRKIKRNLKKD